MKDYLYLKVKSLAKHFSLEGIFLVVSILVILMMFSLRITEGRIM